LAEIDDPRHHHAHERYGDPWARLRFYQRFNVTAFVAPYFQPSLLPGSTRAYHLMLCRVPPAGSPPEPTSAEGARVRAFLAEYFADCEGEGALEDPQVRWLLSCYNDDIELASLSELSRVPDPDVPAGR
jgi:hypothetical protein